VIHLYYKMPLHSVRFDDETEEILEQVCEATGESVSAALKRGILALRDRLVAKRANPYEVYRLLDLGPGGYATAPARRAKREVGPVIRRKHGR
jgi:hypothetical protein